MVACERGVRPAPLPLTPLLPFERIVIALLMRPSSRVSSVRLLFNVEITLSIGVASLEILPAATGVAEASYRKSRSIKGDVKKNTSAATGGHLVIQPCVVMRRCDFAFPQVHCHVVATPFGF